MDLGLKDKVVVCMSSASGFGKGIATEFAHEGAKVVVWIRRSSTSRRRPATVPTPICTTCSTMRASPR